MSLKTTYKNDIFSGKRKYQITQNADGTVSLDDVTSYQQAGDIFNADDINATNLAVNETMEEFGAVKTDNAQFKTDVGQSIETMQREVASVKAVKAVTLSASNWSSAAPYSQTINVSGITAEDTPIIALYLSGTPSAAAVKAQRKAFGYTDRAISGNGRITFYCYEKKPESDFAVSIKGE